MYNFLSDNPTIIKLKEIAKEYNIQVLNIDKTYNKPNEMSSTFNEIFVNNYSDLDCLVCSFFHELGHTLNKHRYDKTLLQVQIEIWAWQTGFDLMNKYGFNINSKQTTYMLERLNNYSSYEFREYAKEGLNILIENYKTKIKNKESIINYKTHGGFIE